MASRQHILLLMTTRTYRAGAFLAAAERLGVEVVLGTDQPQVLAQAAPSRFLTVDFHHPEQSSEKIVTFAQSTQVNAILAAEDEEVILAAQAATALHLPHSPPQAVITARDKGLMREALAQAGAPIPGFQRLPLNADPETLAGQVSYPCVIKPLALSASRGVIRANHPGEFVHAFYQLREILRQSVPTEGSTLEDGEFLVEEYIPGFEVAVEGILSRGELQVLAIFDKPDPLEGPYFEETIYVTPSRLGAQDQDDILAATAQAARALGLEEGPVHAELRLNPEGPWIIEVAPRSIGGLCSKALRFDDGQTLEELILRHALGEDIRHIAREPQASGVMMIPIPATGVFLGVEGLEAARGVPGVEEVILSIPVGGRVVPLPYGDRYLGFIFARDESPEEVEAALRVAHHHLIFDIQPGERPS